MMTGAFSEEPMTGLTVLAPAAARRCRANWAAVGQHPHVVNGRLVDVIDLTNNPGMAARPFRLPDGYQLTLADPNNPASLVPPTSDHHRVWWITPPQPLPARLAERHPKMPAWPRLGVHNEPPDVEQSCLGVLVVDESIAMHSPWVGSHAIELARIGWATQHEPHHLPVYGLLLDDGRLITGFWGKTDAHLSAPHVVNTLTDTPAHGGTRVTQRDAQAAIARFAECVAALSSATADMKQAIAALSTARNQDRDGSPFTIPLRWALGSGLFTTDAIGQGRLPTTPVIQHAIQTCTLDQDHTHASPAHRFGPINIDQLLDACYLTPTRDHPDESR